MKASQRKAIFANKNRLSTREFFSMEAKDRVKIFKERREPEEIHAMRTQKEAILLARQTGKKVFIKKDGTFINPDVRLL